MKRVIHLILLTSLPVLTAAPAVNPDLVVATDGSGQFRTVQGALDSIPKGNRERLIVLIKDGTYREKVRIDASFVTLRGQSRRGTRIEFAQGADDFRAKPDVLGIAVVNLRGHDVGIRRAIELPR
jgi:pectinesterase